MSDRDSQAVRTQAVHGLLRPKRVHTSSLAARRMALPSAIIIVGAGIAALVAVSPLALRMIGSLPGLGAAQQHWPDLWRCVCSADRPCADRCRCFHRVPGTGDSGWPCSVISRASCASGRDGSRGSGLSAVLGW
jgi:hypothetical protein